MSLNKSKGNMYEFVTHTWNTIKGACPHDCSYCYMKRWGNQKPVRFDEKELKTDLGSGNFIFVGSSCDMFAGSIPQEWIEKTLNKLRSGNHYLLQSKNPKRILEFDLMRKISMNASICTTIETNRWYPEIMRDSPTPAARAEAMNAMNPPSSYKPERISHRLYVTIEPIIDFDLEEMLELIRACNPEQVNIGADSGGNNLPEPSAEKLRDLIAGLREFTTIHSKRNLGRLLK